MQSQNHLGKFYVTTIFMLIHTLIKKLRVACTPSFVEKIFLQNTAYIFQHVTYHNYTTLLSVAVKPKISHTT